MARQSTAFFCTECGNETPRWQGQCPACHAWNTLAEEPAAPRARAARSGGPPADRSHSAPIRLRAVERQATRRWSTGLDELDFVLGGGIVPGSLVLLGGEPGIGKSTLLLQVAGKLEAGALTTLYVSGEESAAQIRVRADRLEVAADDVTFLAETDLDLVLNALATARPSVVIIDSIQTVFTRDLDSAPGSVAQVRECAARLQREAKQSGTAVWVIGHVTKDGVVAGPRTLEHIVDTVLLFEGSARLDHRIVRASKNRFGSVDEIGVFRMSATGLTPVAHPSELFLGERSEHSSGSAVAVLVEGSRPLLVEVQALCTQASYGAAQRVANGFDRQRLALLLAVLERRAGIPFGQLDVFLNVVGGVRAAEPAADCAVAAALVSASRDQPLPAQDAFLGELGLGGEIRTVSQLERRLAEVARMGFRRAHVPGRTRPAGDFGQLVLLPTPDLRSLIERIGP
ncbi:MAG: DNA repair protein RadA [Longimicrobiales bacterium]